MSKVIAAESTGIGIGTVIAVLLSWTINQSILWCVIHGLLGWFYIFYYLFEYGLG